MCQENPKRIHQKSVKCYRVYKFRGNFEEGGVLVSYYKDREMPALGVEVTADMQNLVENVPSPFHAFRTKKDVESWALLQCGLNDNYGKYVVFECILSKDLMGGIWDCDSNEATRTCTGKALTIVRKVAAGDNRNVKWITTIEKEGDSKS